MSESKPELNPATQFRELYDQEYLSVFRSIRAVVLDSAAADHIRLRASALLAERTIGEGETDGGVARRRDWDEVRQVHERAGDALRSVLFEGEARGDQDPVHVAGERGVLGAVERAHVDPGDEAEVVVGPGHGEQE